MSRRHWVEDEYEYTRPQRYNNVSTNVYVTPQRYMTTRTESYSPVGKTYVRGIPNVAHQRLTTTSYPPRSYTPHHYDEERILGYRVPPSSHAITTTSYRPWLEEEPMMDYMPPYQPPPPRQIEPYRPSYADTWKTHISPSTRARWHTDEDEDYYVDEEIDPQAYMPPKVRRPRQQQPPVNMASQATGYPGYFEERYTDMLSTDRRPVSVRPDALAPYRPAPRYSYADKYAADLEESLESSGAIVPGNYFAARHQVDPTSSTMLRRPIPKPRGLQKDPHVSLRESPPPREMMHSRNKDEIIYESKRMNRDLQRTQMEAPPRGPYEDLADEYPAHGRKYVVVPMRNVYSNIYNMSYYRKPMQQANIVMPSHKKPVARVSSYGRDTELRSTKRELRSIQLESDKIEDIPTTTLKPKKTTDTADAPKTDENHLTADHDHDHDDKSQGSESGKKEKKKKHKKKEKVDVDLDDEEALMRMVEEELAKEEKAKKKHKKAAHAAEGEGAGEGGEAHTDAAAEGAVEKPPASPVEVTDAAEPAVAVVKPRTSITSVDVTDPDIQQIVTKRTIVIDADEGSAEDEINRLINETKGRIGAHLGEAGGDNTVKITRVVKVSAEKEEGEPVVITEVNEPSSETTAAEPTVTEPAQ